MFKLQSIDFNNLHIVVVINVITTSVAQMESEPLQFKIDLHIECSYPSNGE